MIDNYKEFKNLVHNDLKITKDDIREMILEAVLNEVKAVLNNESFIHTLIEKQIREVMNNPYQTPNWKRIFSLDTTVYNAVCDEVSKLVKSKLELRFKEE